MSAISIRLNGRPHPLPEAMSLSSLLETLGMAGKPVVIEVDQNPVLSRDYPGTMLADGAKVEIIVLAAGG
ncbi:MAG: sulfur carrier protein ThiS [Verrucomicrobiota bacterium]